MMAAMQGAWSVPLSSAQLATSTVAWLTGDLALNQTARLAASLTFCHFFFPTCLYTDLDVGRYLCFPKFQFPTSHCFYAFFVAMMAAMWGVWFVPLSPALPATSTITYCTGDHTLIQTMCLATLVVAFGWFLLVFLISVSSPLLFITPLRRFGFRHSFSSTVC